MLDRLLGFCCLFVFNCQLYAKSGHGEFSWAEERGISPAGAGAQGRTEVRLEPPWKTAPLRRESGAGDPASAFLCTRKTWSRPSEMDVKPQRGAGGGRRVPRRAAAPPAEAVAVYSPPELGLWMLPSRR